MRRNIDAWWPYVEQGAEAIVMTASGCGVFVKDYGQVLRDDKFRWLYWSFTSFLVGMLITAIAVIFSLVPRSWRSLSSCSRSRSFGL